MIRRQKLGLPAFIAVWLVLVVAGFRMLANYEFSTNSETASSRDWPLETPLHTDAHRATLVVFAHPQCPCTRATLSELARLVARVRDRPVLHVVFISPKGQPDKWVFSDLWNTATSIPGAQILRDYDGVEARRFGATTSGQTFLFDPQRRLRYRGGITASRGHEGDNAGSGNIVAILNALPTTQPSIQRAIFARAFGCALQANNETTSTVTP